MMPLKILFTCFLYVAIGLVAARPSPGQSSEKDFIAGLYAKTHSAKTAADYTQIIDECATADSRELSQKSRDYCKTLSGWACSRRGELRLTLASDFQRVGNAAQSEAILAQAKEDFDRSLVCDPKRWRAMLGLAIVDVQRQDLKSAIEKFAKVIELEPKESCGYFNRAEVCFEMGNYSAALADYEHVVKLNAADTQALTGRAHCFAMLSEQEKARADYDVVCKLLPASGVARMNRGDLLTEMGDYRMAILDHETAMKAGVSAATLRLAMLLATCADPEFIDLERAKKLAKQAVDSSGETVETMKCMLAVCQAAGDKVESEKIEKRIAQLQEESSTMARHAALKPLHVEQK
jgi:tetratricopeptide (TPR) repeat protein